MAKELNEDTSLNISIKTLIGIGFGIVTLVGLWFTLQADIAEKLAKNTQDSSWILKKEALLEEAILYSPQRQQVAFGLANTKHMLRKDKEALVILQKALDDDKHVKFSWYSLINLHNVLGNTIKVEALKLEAREYGIKL